MLENAEKTILFEDKFLKVEWIPSKGERFVLCFTGIGHSLGGIDIQGSEFAGTGTRIGIPIFITDKTRSWGNAYSLEALTTTIERVTDGRPMVSLGNSMGAFLAIATSKAMRISDVIAFAPQYSVDPAIMPKEVRWHRYRNAITKYRIPSLEFSFTSTCRYHVFVGSAETERMHWSLFPSSENVAVYIAPGQEHDVALWMKARNYLGAAVTDCLNTSISPPEIASTYGLTLRQ